MFYLFQAFVHDPLINWRLFNFNEVPQVSTYVNTHVQPVVNGDESTLNRELSQPQRGARERELLQVVHCFSCRNLLACFRYFFIQLVISVGCQSTWRC